MTQFTVENTTYRNGEKPVAIYYIKEAAVQKILSVGPDGSTFFHSNDGAYFISRNKDPRDLIQSPPPPRPWSCAGDVPEEAEWITCDGLRVPWRILAVESSGVSIDGSLLSWEYLKETHARWSATRTGEYVACTTVAPMPGQGVGE